MTSARLLCMPPLAKLAEPLEVGGLSIRNRVFLAPMSIFLGAGIYDALTRPSRIKWLVFAGFATAPVASVIVLESYTLPRMMGLVPFGILLSVGGVVRIWNAPLTRTPAFIRRTASASSLTSP